MAEAPNNEPTQDATAKANLQVASLTPLPVEAFATEAYQFLSQLSPQDREHLLSKLKELLSQIQPATISGNAQLDPVTANGSLSGTAAGTSTATATLAETLPPPQAKQLTDLINRANLTLTIVKIMYYLYRFGQLVGIVEGEPGHDTIDTIIEQGEQLFGR